MTGVAFDPLHCDDKDYRFASVGDDCKLLLWDFSVSALHKPKQVHITKRQKKGGVEGGIQFKVMVTDFLCYYREKLRYLLHYINKIRYQ